jgi:hypothetical protein
MILLPLTHFDGEPNGVLAGESNQIAVSVFLNGDDQAGV